MTNEADIGVQMNDFRRDFASLRDALEEALVGQREAIEMALVALFAGGHLLLEGPPGVGKTLLGRTLAELLDVDYRRIQFTSDLMPADVIGTYVVMESQGRRRFEFTQGPDLHQPAAGRRDQSGHAQDPGGVVRGVGGTLV